MQLLRAVLLCLVLAQLIPASAFHRGQNKDDREAMRPNPAAASVDAGALASCPAGNPLGEMSLMVNSVSGDKPLPFASIVHLTEGDTVTYTPFEHGRAKRSGEVSLVLVPAKISGKEELLVTEPRDAAKPQQWSIPRTVALAVFVYGPQGLSRHRVRNFLSQDESLVAQLAEYADKTTQTEALIAALTDSESSTASVNAALTGFASQYGVSVAIDKTAPPAQQAQALFSAINPQLASYSPLAGNAASRATQTASLATAAAGLFFGSPVGLLAGGTGMLLDLRSIAFPDTQFRSSFSLPLKNSHMNLCGERGTTPPRTRLAYLWASRIPGVPKPDLQIGNANYLPVHQKSPLPVTLSDIDWKFLQRARDWYLEDGGGKHTPISVVKLQNQKSIELDLAKAQLPAGTYHLGAFWDWVNFSAHGDVRLSPLGDLSAAHLLPTSQDKLMANSGKQPVTLTGADFEFATRVELKRAGDEFAVSQPARFVLPQGLRRGPQTTLDVLVDTKDLDPGPYQLLITQTDEQSRAVPVQILPNPPKLNNLPILVNTGVATQHYVLKGERLDQISGFAADNVKFELGPASSSGTERSLTVQLTSTAEPAGSKLPVQVTVQDRSTPLTFLNGIEIAGPLPTIASSKLAASVGQSVTLRSDEFPAGATLSATVDVKNITAQSSLRLGCSGSADAVTLSLGQQTDRYSLQQLSPDQLYLLFDTNGLSAGCLLQVTVDNGQGSKSQPYPLARIIRLPKIDAFEPVSGTPVPEAKLPFLLRGWNLEMIERAGWDPASGIDVNALPTPIPGEGQRQSLTVELPAVQTGKEELYVWLRGDKEARITTWKAPALPKPPPPVLPPAPLSRAN